MSTSTSGGHVNTVSERTVVGRRRRRLHSDEFKANAVASCMQPGMSMAAVAMACGVNANLLRRWVRDAELRAGADLAAPRSAPKPLVSAAPATFVPMALPTKSGAAAIRIELRRGATLVTVTWPSEAAADCAAWMRELLR